MPDDSSIQGTVTNDDSKSDSKVKKTLRSGGRAAREEGQKAIDRVAAEADSRSTEQNPNTGRTVMVDSYKRGGKVKRTGRALLHKGEVVRGKKKGRSKRSRYVGRY